MENHEEEGWARLRQAVKEQLELLGWTQAELARRAEVDPDTVTNLLEGHHRSRASTRRRIATALGWAADDAERVLQDPDFDPVREDVWPSFRSGQHGDAELSLELVEQARAAFGEAALQDKHRLIEEAVEVLTDQLGLQVTYRAPQHPRYDFAWRTPGGELAIGEAKVTESRGSEPVYGGMGQLVAYRSHLQDMGEPVAMLLLVLDRPPTDEERHVLEQQGVRVVWRGRMDDLATLQA